jgi:mRNA deadenylase 3'-5' endonuclease subunit Ccr4
LILQIKTLGRKRFSKNGDLNINQIGSYNAVSLNIKAESINLDVLQNGDKNTFESNKHVNELILKVVQDGQNNTIKDVSRYHANGTDVNMEFIQKGIIKVFRIMGLTHI